MASTFDRPLRVGMSPLLVMVLATASLYLAREILIPLALAILFTFLLAPAVRRLESLGLHRGLASTIAVALFLTVIGAVGWIAGRQVVSLAGKLPEYRENIAEKLRTLHAPPKGDLGKAAQALKELEKEAAGQPKGAAAEKASPEKPGAVPTTPLTQAMEDAGGRVSRYLLMQLVVNACFGIPLGVALYFIGIPNALLWGLLAMLLRFIPYLGAPAAALLPIAFAFAISDGWQLVAWTVGVIAVLDFTIAYVIEPWLYGESTGLSPAAVVFSAMFWTWLWGPIGLLLATPLTVCISVVGRYIPQWSFLSVMLSRAPALPAPVRFYQRLVALEYEEALDLAEQFVKEHGLASLFECVLLPALLMAKRDRLRASLDERRERFVFDSLLRLAEELNDRAADDKKADGKTPAEDNAAEAPPPASAPEVCIAPAQDDADYIAAAMLARLIDPAGYQAFLMPKEMLAAELVDRVAERSCGPLCICAVPPSAAASAAYLCKRLRSRLPEQKIVVALWHAEGNIERTKQRLLDAGADEVVTRLPEALERLRTH